MTDERTILTSGEVAHIFGVDPKTIMRWSVAGKIPSFRTLGGHRRFYADDVQQLITTGHIAPKEDD